MSGCDTPPERVRVEFAIRDDESALRVAAVLGSLGYEPVRDLAQTEADLFAVVTRALAWRYRLPECRAQVLELVLRGARRAEIVEALGLDLAKVKWELHQIYEALEVSGSEAVLRKALHLEAGAAWLREPWRQREVLEQLEHECSEVLAALREENPARVDRAARALEDTLARARALTNL